MSGLVARLLSGVRAVMTEQILERALFALGIGVIAFGYGVATMRWQIFPYGILHQAELAWDAVKALEPESLPTNILEFVEDPAAIVPIRTLSAHAGREPVLIMGGFYQRTDVCPTYGCLAWVMDRKGAILHTWEVDPNAVIDGLDGLAGTINDLNIYAVSAALAENGSLVVTLQGRNTYPYQVGLFKVDVNGKLLWKTFNGSHHWATVGPDGRIYTPSLDVGHDMRFFAHTRVRMECETGENYLEGVRIVAPDGTSLRNFSMSKLIAEADLPGLMYALRDGCDPFHVNGIALVNEAAAAKVPGLAAGDLLVSLREPSAFIVLDQETGALKHVVAGRTAAQHSPQILPDGNLIAFDNRGGHREFGGTRIARIDLATGEVTTVFPEGDEGELLPVYSDKAGVLRVNAAGTRALMSDSRTGRVIEVDLASGEPLWVYEKISTLKPFLEARGLKAKADHVRFSTQGAEYVEDMTPFRR